MPDLHELVNALIKEQDEEFLAKQRQGKGYKIVREQDEMFVVFEDGSDLTYFLMRFDYFDECEVCCFNGHLNAFRLNQSYLH